MLNHCCLTVRVKPARIPGHKPQVTLDPAVDYITISNKARTALQTKKRSLHVARSSKSEKNITISGTISTKSKQKGFLVVLDNPHLYTAHVVQLLLKKHKIICRGSIVVGTTPTKAPVLVRHHSEPISQLIRFMVKDSDNLYADALFKMMGAVTSADQGNWARGKKAVESFLVNEIEFPKGTFDIYDGSGLSHSNRVSPNHLAQLLMWAHKSSPHKDIFIESLPVSGIDGTLNVAICGKPVHSKVKAKTGSLTGVSSLAGYITRKKELSCSLSSSLTGKKRDLPWNLKVS